MIKPVFTLFDEKAKYHKQPFIFQSKGEAIRAFSDIANDNKTEVGKHPADFHLYHIADFDEETATYKAVEPISHLGSGLDFIKPA